MTWVVDEEAGLPCPAAVLESVKTGVRMEVETTLPGIQFYAGNYMAGCPAGKGGTNYGRRVCRGPFRWAKAVPDAESPGGFRG